MRKWLTRARGALGMGATWALLWAVFGVLIGATSNLTPGLPWDAFFRVFDAPLPMLALPGFIGGALFSLVLGVAARHRRFDELSVPRFAAWGAVGGLLLSLVPIALAAIGFLTPAENSDLWQSTAIISGPFTLLSSMSAAVSLTLARKAEDRATLRDGERVELDTR